MVRFSCCWSCISTMFAAQLGLDIIKIQFLLALLCVQDNAPRMTLGCAYFPIANPRLDSSAKKAYGIAAVECYTLINTFKHER